MNKLPLAGIRICDFTWAWAGPQCTRLLADMGAEVIKIESGKRPDIGRRLPPFNNDKPGLNRSGRFQKRNRGKLSITLNMTHPKGIDLVKQIIRKSDMVTENFSRRVMKKFGLEYEAVKEIKQDIIYLSLSAFGSKGPYKDYVAYGPNQAALCGLGSIVGYKNGPPFNMGVALGDPAAGLYGAVALLSALYHRKKTGQGQNVELSQTEILSCVTGQALMDYTMNERIGVPEGNSNPSMAPHGFYPCSGDDQWVSIAICNEEEWQSFCIAIGNPDWCHQEKFSSCRTRLENEAELDRQVSSWTMQRNKMEIMEMLQKVNVAAMPMFDGPELIANQHLQERDFLADIKHPEVGKHVMHGLSMKLSDSPGRIERAPLLGEHNQYVFGELLGLEEDKIAKLQEEKIIY